MDIHLFFSCHSNLEHQRIQNSSCKSLCGQNSSNACVVRKNSSSTGCHDWKKVNIEYSRLLTSGRIQIERTRSSPRSDPLRKSNRGPLFREVHVPRVWKEVLVDLGKVANDRFQPRCTQNLCQHTQLCTLVFMSVFHIYTPVSSSWPCPFWNRESRFCYLFNLIKHLWIRSN